ncbi:CshA/CshB family fibrillar adhesin-related protein [Novosphingobium sp.]|uniref:CshA/CshB family fibrillar adhesin-related protein n=1 Tax=Novosphingobium sp. TaxID=1874826 RepID=UPI003B52399D
MFANFLAFVRRALFLATLWALSATAAFAANCYPPTSQGSTGPNDWQSYCWVDFSTYNNTTAMSASGQNFSLTLQDGTVMQFNLKVTGVSLNPVSSPSWTGAAIGNTAMLGIGGLPVLYATGGGNTTATISALTLTPPSGGTAATNYMMAFADGESTNSGETLQFVTNGGNWVVLDQAGPTSGSSYPTEAIVTNTATLTGNANATVGAYVFGTTKPTTITTTLVSGGLQGFMVAVRFASLRLNTTIAAARVAAADQFTYGISSTTTGATLINATSAGTALTGFGIAGIATASGVPLTLTQSMAAGSTDTLSHYVSSLTCTNSTSGSATAMPTGVTTSNYSLGSLAYGDDVMCIFTETPYPHLTLQKALGTGGRQFTGDQFVVNIAQAGNTIATATTTGSAATLATNVTPQTQVTAGTAYTFNEAASGTTLTSQYTTGLGCTNSYAGSATKLPTTVTGSITPAMGDVVLCTLTNTKVASNANLTIVKTSALVSDPINGTNTPRSIPGAIVAYTLTVSNSGPSVVDSNTVLIVDTLPTQLSVGTAATPVFTQGSPTSALTFTASTDIAFSKATTAPTSFAACNYTPTSAFDPAVRYICLNPKGTMAGSNGTAPNFAITIQAKVN